MKKSKNLQLILIFLAIISFLIYVAWRNEKKMKIYNLEKTIPTEKINIKQPVEIKSPIINNDEGKG